MAGVPTYCKDKPGLLQTVVCRYDVSKDKTGKLAFTLPKGAVIVPNASNVIVSTVFNGTTPTITLGSVASPANIAASADVAPAALGMKALTIATLNTNPMFLPQPADVDVYFTVGGGGGNTTGVAIFTVCFAYPYFLSDLI